MIVSRVESTIRTTRRYSEVIAVLARHGFDGFLDETGLTSLLDRARAMIGHHRAEEDKDHHQPLKVRARLVLEDLGPTFIKLGQVLSTRPDLIPPDWAKEFAKLQDDCPKVAFEKIKAQIETSLDGSLEELFEHVDPEPLAAGSIAQVHRGRLESGDDVAIKVRRPEAPATIAADIDILEDIASLAEKYFDDQGFSPSEVVQEFSRQIERELDLEREGHSTDRLARAFSENENVFFAKVHWGHTTTAVLTLDYVQAGLLSRTDIVSLSEDVRRRVVEVGTDAVFRQCLEIGFFHADPHPGNLAVNEHGQLWFIDCGMVGHLDQQSSMTLAELIYAVINGNLDRVIRTAIQLSNADPALEFDRRLRSDVWEFVSRFDRNSLKGLKLGQVLDQFFELLRRYEVRCPSDLVYLIKAMSTIESVGASLDPSFDIISHVQPHIERLVRQRFGLRASRRRMRRSLLGYAELFEDIPSELRTVFAQFRRRDFTVSLDHRGLPELTDMLRQTGAMVAWAMVTAATIIAAAIMILADAGTPGWPILSAIGFVGLGLALVMVGVLIRLGNRHKKD